MIVGIDLGTTHSLIGALQDGKPKLFSPEGKTLVPSVVAVDGEKLQAGEKAATLRKTNPFQTLFSLKRFMGRSRKDFTNLDSLPFDFSSSDERTIRVRVGDRVITPVEYSAHLLSYLKSEAEKQSGHSIQKAVITVPAYFDDSQRQATKTAGEIAGLEVARIVNEPTAACLAYGLHLENSPGIVGHVAVFDLGGGTFDLSILRVENGVFEVLATRGDTALGGDDFNEAVALQLERLAASTFGEGWGKSAEAKHLLWDVSEKLKRSLTDKTSHEAEWTFEGKTFSTQVSRETFDAWIQPVVDRCLKPSELCVSDSGLTLKEIDHVVLVGGSTRVPLVRSFVKSFFGKEPLCSLNPDEVVALGACVQAGILEGKSDLLLLDVIPLSLGLETMGGVVSKLVHRNSTLPVVAKEHFTTYVDGQTKVAFHIVQGERELANDNRSLARFELTGLPPLPAGVPKIEVVFMVNADGILSVTATELRTHLSAHVEVKPSYGLTDEEMEKMLLDSFENAEKDMEKRFLIEAIQEGETILRATQKSLTKGRDLLDTEELEEVEQTQHHLEYLLKNPMDRGSLRKAIDALNTSTLPLAERLLNRAVSDALHGKEIV